MEASAFLYHLYDVQLASDSLRRVHLPVLLAEPPNLLYLLPLAPIASLNMEYTGAQQPYLLRLLF